MPKILVMLQRKVGLLLTVKLNAYCSNKRLSQHMSENLNNLNL